MARAQIPTIDPRDPDGVRKALRAVELILQQHGDAVDLLLAQRALVPVELTGRAPDNRPVPTGITTTFNQAGGMTVELRWTYEQGARPSTQTVVVVKKGAAPLAPPVYWEDDVYTVPAGATYTRIDLPSEHNYRFGVAVARGTPGGLEVGEVQAPTANPDWADIGGVAPVFDIPGLARGQTWNLTGAINLPEATWTTIGGPTINIPTWATNTKVLVTAAINLAITATTAGVFQLFWRVKRDTPGTVIFTSNQQRIDSSIAATWFVPIGAFMDSTTLTGTQRYTMEFLKDDAGAASNAVSISVNSHVAVSYWSY